MKSRNFLTLGVGIIVILIIAGIFYWKNIRGIGPAINQPPQNITEVINTAGMPLKLPPGFGISIFAKDLPGVRVMEEDTFGNFWVSQPSQGTVSLLEVDKDTGKIGNQGIVFRDLNNPHGLAINPDAPFALYIAEEDKIIWIPIYSELDVNKVADLPADGGHFTRTIGFGPDKRLYASIGSSCNVCNEADSRRAKIFSMNSDGTDFKEFARGLRNSVFFTWHPVTKKMWATEMGRDLLGDDIPPDEINIVEEGKNYGWPICYGENIHDTNFDKNVYFRNPCMEPFETSSYIDIQAHSAPLGLAFVPADSDWPRDYWNNLLVAYHGSWNRSVPTGYKVVRYKLDEQGRILEPAEDFISGWLTSEGALGRPVDILIKPNGKAYITDDRAGVIYEVSYKKS